MAVVIGSGVLLTAPRRCYPAGYQPDRGGGEESTDARKSQSYILGRRAHRASGSDDGINDNDDDDGANCTNGRAEQQRFFGLIMSKYLGERAASSFQCGAALLFVEVAISSKRADKQTYLALHDE